MHKTRAAASTQSSFRLGIKAAQFVKAKNAKTTRPLRAIAGGNVEESGDERRAAVIIAALARDGGCALEQLQGGRVKSRAARARASVIGADHERICRLRL
jgi:hypothetical protein